MISDSMNHPHAAFRLSDLSCALCPALPCKSFCKCSRRYQEEREGSFPFLSENPHFRFFKELGFQSRQWLPHGGRQGCPLVTILWLCRQDSWPASADSYPDVRPPGSRHRGTLGFISLLQCQCNNNPGEAITPRFPSRGGLFHQVLQRLAQ